MISFALAIMLGLPAAAQDKTEKVDFATSVLPILESRCASCHGAPHRDANGRMRRPRGDLRLDGKTFILEGGQDEVALTPGDPSQSAIYTRVSLPADDADIMPAKGDPLTAEQIESIRRWIEEGAHFGSWVGATEDQPAPVEKKTQSASEGSGPEATPTVPTSLIPPRIAVLEHLSEGVTPLTPSELQRTGKLAQLRPEPAGGPLLRVEFLSNEEQVDDAQVALLGAVSDHVTALDLAQTAITDRALDVAATMPRLTRLDLHQTRITDAGLAKLAGLTELRYLNLRDTRITDAALESLAGLAHLEALYLADTQVSDQGIAALQAKLPKTKIVSKITLPKVRVQSTDDE